MMREMEKEMKGKEQKKKKKKKKRKKKQALENRREMCLALMLKGSPWRFLRVDANGRLWWLKGGTAANVVINHSPKDKDEDHTTNHAEYLNGA